MATKKRLFKRPLLQLPRRHPCKTLSRPYSHLYHALPITQLHQIPDCPLPKQLRQCAFRCSSDLTVLSPTTSCSGSIAPTDSVIQANDEWQHFASRVLSQDIHLPPYGRAEVLLQPREVGVFPIENNRNLSESELQRTITVIPEGMVASSWHPLCAEFSVHSPQPGANLSTPLVIQGSFKEAEGQ